MIESTTLPDLDEKIRTAKERREQLWQEFQRMEKDAEPIMARIRMARENLYKQDQKVNVLITIKAEGLQ